VKKLFGILLVLTLVLSFSVVATTPVAAQATYYVATTGDDGNDGSSGSPWLTIQHAVNTVASGDTIIVAAGTYNEALSVAQTVTLKGSGSHSTIVEPVASAHAVKITGDNVELTLRDMQINVTGTSRLVDFSGRSNTTVVFQDVDMDYSQEGRGVQAHNSPNTSITFTGSTMDASDAAGKLGSGYAILLLGCSDSSLTITDSTVTAAHYGIYVGSPGAEITVNDGSEVTGYAALAIPSSGAGSVISVEDSVLTGRTFWSGYFYNPPHEDANSFATVAFQTSDCTMHVKNSIITNEWVGDNNSYQMLIHIGRPGYNFMNNTVYLDKATQLLNTNGFYAPISVGGDPDKGNRWYIEGVKQNLPPITYDFYVHPDGSDANDGLRPVTAFRTIQAALDAAGPDKTILVGEGAYADFGPWLDAEVTSGMIALGEDSVVVTYGVSAESTGGSTNTVLGIASLAANPTGVSPGFRAGAVYVDVHVGGTLPSQLVVEVDCPGSCSRLELLWWDGAQWRLVTPTVVVDGKIQATLSATSSPTIAELTGTPFGLGSLSTVGWEGSSVNKAAVMAPWIAFLAVIIGGASLLVRRRRAQIQV